MITTRLNDQTSSLLEAAIALPGFSWDGLDVLLRSEDGRIIWSGRARTRTGKFVSPVLLTWDMMNPYPPMRLKGTVPDPGSRWNGMVALSLFGSRFRALHELGPAEWELVVFHKMVGQTFKGESAMLCACQAAVAIGGWGV